MFLVFMVALLIAGASFTFLYIQLGPSCREHLPKAQTSTFCTCQGFEYVRIKPRANGQVSTICLGVIKDRWIAFSNWGERELMRSDRVIIEMGIQKILDSSDPRVIRKIGSVFEGFSDGWRSVKQTVASPQYRFTFVTFVLSASGTNTDRKEVRFDISDNKIDIQGGLQRPLNPNEQAVIANLVRP